MQLQSKGSDELGRFTVSMPGHCGTCDTDQDVTILYNTASLKKGLHPIDPAFTVVAHRGKPPHSLGLTCGCYGKFHRQIAHIRNKTVSKGKKKYQEAPTPH